jgi:hypothetical protein
MIGIKQLSICIASLFLLASAPASACAQRRSRNRPLTTRATPKNGKEAMKSSYSVIAEGSQSDAEEPFIAVIREPSAYEELRKTVKGVPARADDAFKTSAVVAAFLGQRSTAGFGISITTSSDGKLRIAETRPPNGAMLAQVITSPYKIVSVPLENPEAQVPIDSGDPWAFAGKAFEVTKGEFEMVGGFAGSRDVFGLEGRLRMQQMGNLVTVLFDLKASNAKKPRALATAGTGLVQPDGTFMLTAFDAGTLIDPPQPFLRATGKMPAGGKLHLDLRSIASRIIADGYVGKGSLDARGLNN